MEYGGNSRVKLALKLSAFPVRGTENTFAEWLRRYLDIVMSILWADAQGIIYDRPRFLKE